MEAIKEFIEGEYPSLTEQEKNFLFQKIDKAVLYYSVHLNKENYLAIIDCKLHYLFKKKHLKI